MPRLDTLSRLNEIAKLFVCGLPRGEEHRASRTFGLGGTCEIALLDENVKAFDDALHDLLASLPGVKGTLSSSALLDKLIPRMREKKMTGGEFSSEEAEEFENEICGLPLRKFRVIRRIFGLMLSGDAMPIVMGDFVIDFGRRLFGSRLNTSTIALKARHEELDELHVECTVEARDADRATEIADLLFCRFELIFRLFIGHRTERVEVGILDYVGPQLRDRIVLAEDGSTNQGSSWHGALQPIPLDDPYFSSPGAPFPRLFQLVSRENSELERHVVRCAEWTGQAISDRNPASAFVKAAIALEVMFSANEKGPITPSIMAQIAESCAYLLGKDESSSLNIEREVKRLYGVRSAVVHSGKDSVDEKDLNALIQICRLVVIVLLSNRDFAEMDTMNKLAEYFRRRKYSSSTLAETAAQV